MCTGNIHTSQKTRNTGHLGAFDDKNDIIAM